MVSPDLAAIKLDLAELLGRGRACVEQKLDAVDLDVQRARDRLIAQSPLARIARDRQATHDQAVRVRLALEGRLRSLADQLAGRRFQLAALSPQATLDRGYSIVMTEAGTVVRSAASVSPGDRLALEFGDGAVDVTATGSHGESGDRSPDDHAVQPPDDGRHGPSDGRHGPRNDVPPRLPLHRGGGEVRRAAQIYGGSTDRESERA